MNDKGIAIQLLGGFSISNGQSSLPEAAWKSKRARSLVKLLALTPGHRLHRDQIIDTLWPDSDLSAAANNFHQTLFAARRALESVAPGFLLLEEGTLSLSGDLNVDVDAFEAAVARAGGSQNPTVYQSALALYRGDLLPDDPYEEWTLARRASLKQVYLDLLLKLARLYEDRKAYIDGIAALQRLLASDRSHEEAHAGLMRLYALRSQRQAALRQYQALRDVLRSELDVEPGPETTQLYEEIQSGRFPNTKPEPERLPEDQPTPLPPLGERKRHNLPYQLTSFIGRENETGLVRGLIQEHRLVTLTGAGGTGKTRLALRAAEGLIDSFQDGVFLVELASLSDPELIPQACAQTLEMIPQPGTPHLTSLLHYLEKKKLFLILDNVEHILAACASLVDALLKACPGLTILATSREILNLPGESAFRVPSLTTPDPHLEVSLDQTGQYEAVRLFVDRARLVSPEFALTEKNAPSIATICQRLDGIPLAIELAAGRGRMISPEQIAARLIDTFHLLTSGNRSVLPRQQTLRATIDWSYDLLSQKERLLLGRLSTFTGGWTLEAAEAVCADETGLDTLPGNPTQDVCERLESSEVLDLLSSLVDKSLIITVVSESGTRFRMLETIRQYANDRLLQTGCAEPARDRHLAYFANLTGQAEPHLRGKGQVEWLDRLEGELDNLRAAMDWSLNRRVDLGLKIAADMYWFWWIRNLYAEARDWLKKLLSREEYNRKNEIQPGGFEYNRVLQRARSLRVYVLLNSYGGELAFKDGTAIIEESVLLLRNLLPAIPYELALSLHILVNYKIGRDISSPEKDEMLQLFQQENMRFETSEYIYFMSFAPEAIGDFSQTKHYLEESLAICREIDDLNGIASRTRTLSLMSLYEGNYLSAKSFASEGIATSHLIKDRWMEALCYLILIEIELAQGKYLDASEYGRVVLPIYLDQIEKMRLSIILQVLLESAWTRGEYEEAIRLASQILEISIEIEPVWNPGTLYFLGKTAQSQGELAQAETHIKIALNEFLKWEVPWKARYLQGTAVLFSRQAKHQPAIQLFGATDEIYRRIWLGLPLREREENEAALTNCREASGEEVFTAAWKGGQAMTLERARDFALEEMKHES